MISELIRVSISGQYFKENPLHLLGERRSAAAAAAAAGKAAKKRDSSGGAAKTPDTERLKVLAEFQGVQEHRQFMKNIGKEKELKSRLKDLQRCVEFFIS